MPKTYEQLIDEQKRKGIWGSDLPNLESGQYIAYGETPLGVKTGIATNVPSYAAGLPYGVARPYGVPMTTPEQKADATRAKLWGGGGQAPAPSYLPDTAVTDQMPESRQPSEPSKPQSYVDRLANIRERLDRMAQVNPSGAQQQRARAEQAYRRYMSEKQADQAFELEKARVSRVEPVTERNKGRLAEVQMQTDAKLFVAGMKDKSDMDIARMSAQIDEEKMDNALKIAQLTMKSLEGRSEADRVAAMERLQQEGEDKKDAALAVAAEITMRELAKANVGTVKKYRYDDAGKVIVVDTSATTSESVTQDRDRNGMGDRDEPAAIEADRLMSSPDSADIDKGRMIMAELEKDYDKALIARFIANHKKQQSAK